MIAAFHINNIEKHNNESIKALRSSLEAVGEFQIVEVKAHSLFTDINEYILKNKPQYFTLSSSQCINYKNKFIELINLISSFTNISCAYSDFDIFHSQTNKTEKMFCHPYEAGLLLQKPCVPLESLFKTEYIIQAGGFDVSKVEMWKSLINQSILLHCPKSLYCIRG